MKELFWREEVDGVFKITDLVLNIREDLGYPFSAIKENKFCRFMEEFAPKLVNKLKESDIDIVSILKGCDAIGCVNLDGFDGLKVNSVYYNKNDEDMGNLHSGYLLPYEVYILLKKPKKIKLINEIRPLK